MDLLEAIDNLKTWTSKQGDRRAPHKPLLLLYALARQSRDQNAKFLFSQIEEDIQALLNEFWKPGYGKRAQYPFWRLRGDGIWEVRSDGKIRETKSLDAYLTDLRKHNATGSFSPGVVREIKDNPDIVQRAVWKLLNEHFSESLHQSILERVGLSYEAGFRENSVRARRDRKFREKILHAYGYRCAVCGFDLHIKNMPVGLEAAHIKWHQHGGPDTEDNGLALCATHHKLLDSGVIALSDDCRVILSKWIHSPSDTGSFVREYRKRRISLPASAESSPNKSYVRWHRKEVFKEPEIVF